MDSFLFKKFLQCCILLSGNRYHFFRIFQNCRYSDKEMKMEKKNVYFEFSIITFFLYYFPIFL